MRALPFDKAEFTRDTNARIESHYENELGYECIRIAFPDDAYGHVVSSWFSDNGLSFSPMTPYDSLDTKVYINADYGNDLTVSPPEPWELSTDESERVKSTSATTRGGTERYEIPEVGWSAVYNPSNCKYIRGVMGRATPTLRIEKPDGSSELIKMPNCKRPHQKKIAVERILSSVGPSTEEVDELKDKYGELLGIRRVSPEIAEKLIDNGIETVEDVRDSTTATLERIVGDTATAIGIGTSALKKEDNAYSA